MLLPVELHRMAEAHGAETAYSLVDGPSLTFTGWDEAASRLARSLTAGGLEPGERVAIQLSPASAQRFLIAYAAVHRAGGVAVPLNPRLSDPEVRTMLGHCCARAAVVDGSSAALFATQLGGGDLRLLVDASTGKGSPATNRSVIAWEEIDDNDATYFQVDREEEDLADILYTSGTTGTPKGVAVRHSGVSLIPAAPQAPAWSGDCWLHASPMFTFAGIAFVYNPMKLGMRGLYQARFDAGRWLEVVAKERPVAAFLVPSMVHLLLDHPAFPEADLSSIVICAIGSAPLSPFALERFQEKIPDAMVSSNYGMTEAGSVYAITPKGEGVRRPGTVGMITPPAEVRIVDPLGGPLGIGEVGEVHLRIPGSSREYFNDPEATAATWQGGWLVTGDLGRLDEDGYLYIVGRNKDVIIRGGNNIHAADVEHVILRHPAVAEAAVVGAPHPVLGEDPVGFVVRKPGCEVSGEELRSFCLEDLADYKVPRRWEFLEELPRNATGKVIKPELRRRLDDREA